MRILRKATAVSVWLAAAIAAGCATPPAAPTQVVTMRAQEGAAHTGFPPAGAVWRLDEQELKALGPILPTPDPPPAPPRSAERDRPQWMLVPSFVYFGSRYGIGVNDPFFWPRYHRFPWRYGYPWPYPWD